MLYHLSILHNSIFNNRNIDWSAQAMYQREENWLRAQMNRNLQNSMRNRNAIILRNPRNNSITLYVSHGYDPATAYKKDFLIRDFHYLTPLLPDETLPKKITFKIRHTADYLTASLEPVQDGLFLVHADAPIHGVAPGQFCVVYDEHHHRCFGSAEITI